MPRKGNNSRTWRLWGKRSNAGIGASKPKRNENKGKIFGALKRLDISYWARKGFNLVSHLSEKYCLVPMTQLEIGTFVKASQRKIWKCYLMSTYGALTCAYKFLATANLASHSQFDVRLAVCIGSFFLSFGTWLPSFAFLLVLEEAVALLNSFPSALLCLNENCGGRKRELFTDVPTCFKVIYATSLPPAVALADLLVMIIWKDFNTGFNGRILLHLDGCISGGLGRSIESACILIFFVINQFTLLHAKTAYIVTAVPFLNRI